LGEAIPGPLQLILKQRTKAHSFAERGGNLFHRAQEREKQGAVRQGYRAPKFRAQAVVNTQFRRANRR